MTRFDLPAPGAPTAVTFPSIVRHTLANGLHVWLVPQATLPVATAALVMPGGVGRDPEHQHGLASLTGDLVDEGAGSHDAIGFADALSRIGARLEVDVGADATTVSVTGVTRVLRQALGLLADVVIRPHLGAADFERVRDLRLGRLRQLSRSASAIAERAYASAVYGNHPYAHGALGTTGSLHALVVDDVRRFWSEMFRPSGATLILGGAIDAEDARRIVADVFDAWHGVATATTLAPTGQANGTRGVVFVDRPGSPQSELRVGHLGPPRRVDDYHRLVTLNALLGGQFTSRINRRLREEQGVTYGARTSFDFRRAGGVFGCETSVQADATARSVQDILAEFAAVRERGAVTPDELALARASLSRGYVRQFETVAQIVRAAAQLTVHGLDDLTFDRFVPSVEAVSLDDVADAARRYIHPSHATAVVVGDASVCRAGLESLGWPIRTVTPEF